MTKNQVPIYITGISVKKENDFQVIDHQVLKEELFKKLINDSIDKLFFNNAHLNKENKSTLIEDVWKNLYQHKSIRIVNNYFFIGKSSYYSHKSKIV